jgi:hypothetical protein
VKRSKGRFFFGGDRIGFLDIAFFFLDASRAGSFCSTN